MIDHFPALGVVLAFSQRLVEQRSQPTAAPQVTAKDRSEAKWIHRITDSEIWGF
jgi:hypothetical protein